MKKHVFQSDWYRPASCLACVYKREHPIHDFSEMSDLPLFNTTAQGKPAGQCTKETRREEQEESLEAAPSRPSQS